MAMNRSMKNRKNTRSGKTVELILVLALSAVAFQSIGQWTQIKNGLSGGVVLDMEVTGNGALIAGTNGGCYISSDDGASWNRIPEIPLTTINAIEVLGSSVIVATNGSGNYVSEDNGFTWTMANNGLFESMTRLLICNGQYFGMTGNYNIVTFNLTSKVWSSILTGIADIRGIGADGTNLFLGSQTARVYKSTNDGVSWSAFNTGLGGTMVFDMSSGGGKVITWTNGGHYVLNSGSSSWSIVPIPFGYVRIGGTGSLFVVGNHNTNFYQSNDGGGSWAQRNDMPPFWAFAFKGLKMFVATQWGVYKSEDNGLNWTDSSTGIGAMSALDLATDGNQVIVATNAGVYTSSNRGSSWVRNQTIPIQSDYKAVALQGSTWIVGTEVVVYRSDNMGLSWELMQSTNGANHITGTTHIAIADGKIYLTDPTQLFKAQLVGDFISRRLTSTTGPGYNYTSLAVDGNRLYNTARRSSGGSSVGYIDAIGQGIAAHAGIPVASVDITGISISPAKFFVATENGGFYVSTNKGLSWTAANPLVASKHVASYNESLFTAGTSASQKIRISTNGGISWAPLIDGLDPGMGDIKGLYTIGSKIVAATEFAGFWIRCIDPPKPVIATMSGPGISIVLKSDAPKGNQWYLNNDEIVGATDATFFPLVVGAYSVKVAIDGCVGPMSDAYVGAVTGYDSKDDLPKLKFYPNPSSKILTISLEGFEVGAIVTIAMATIEWKVVRTESALGGNSISIDIDNLPAGIYLIRAVGPTYTLYGRFAKY